MVRLRSDVNCATELCSAYENRFQTSSHIGHKEVHTFQASCSATAAERAPVWSPGVEWNRCGLLSSRSFSAYKFFCTVTSISSATFGPCNPVNLGNELFVRFTFQGHYCTYPGLVNFAFHRGRTKRAKYRAKPSRRPLKVAVPEEAASPI